LVVNVAEVELGTFDVTVVAADVPPVETVVKRVEDAGRIDVNAPVDAAEVIGELDITVDARELTKTFIDVSGDIAVLVDTLVVADEAVITVDVIVDETTEVKSELELADVPNESLVNALIVGLINIEF